MSNDMCQADVPASCEASSPGTGSSSERRGEAEQAFPLPSTLRAIARSIGEQDPVAAMALFGAADILEKVAPHNMRLRAQVVELRNALREICDSAALTSVADCQIIAEEALAMNARRFKVQHIQRPDEEPALAGDERSQTAETEA